MEETKSVSELKHPAYNPRKICEQDFNNLVQSMREFGDLSGLVKNITTGHIVSGNQRKEAFDKLGAERIVITQRMSDGPDKYGTTAYGYILMPDGGQFGYREVMWDEAKEKAANIAANRITGEWDKDLLAQVNYELSQLENGDDLLALTGQGEDEITKLLQSIGVGPEDESPAEDEQESNKLTFALSKDQKAVVEQALSQAKQTNNIPHTNLDNINGTALYIICHQYVQNSTSQNIDQTQNDTTQTSPAETTAAPDLTSIPTDQPVPTQQ